MSLSIKTRKTDEIVVLDLSGRLTIGEPVLLLRKTIEQLLADGSSKFIVNVAEVPYVDSAGLGELIATFTTIRNELGDAKLLNLTAKAHDLIKMANLLTVFDRYDDEGKAVAALRGEGAA